MGSARFGVIKFNWSCQGLPDFLMMAMAMAPYYLRATFLQLMSWILALTLSNFPVLDLGHDNVLRNFLVLDLGLDNV